MIPAIATVPAALFASEQPAGKVIVTKPLAVDAVVALQPAKLPPKVTVGEAGIPVHVAGNVTVMVLPAESAPPVEAAKPTVHVAVARALVRDPAKVMEVGLVVFSARVCATHGCDELRDAVDVPDGPGLPCSAGAVVALASASFVPPPDRDSAEYSMVVAAPP